MLLRIFLLGSFLAAAYSQAPPANSSDQLSARELYYKETASNEKMPPITRKVSKPAAKVADAKKPAAASQTAPSASSPVTAASNEVARQPDNAVNVSLRRVDDTQKQPPPADHLGLRYRLLMVDKATNVTHPVDADSVFHTGDCLALELQPNRAGYLYVLAKESNGNWHPLFPSPEMEDEPETVQGYSKERAPQHYCYELDEHPGEEHLFIILSRNPEQVKELHFALLKRDAPKQMADARPPSTDSLFNKEASDTVAEFGSRGFKITKVSAAAAQDEKYSVFVVPASLEKKDTVFAEVIIKHE
jgi:hypothetical protein